MSLSYLEPQSPRTVIACGVLKSELEELKGNSPDIETIYIDQNYHRTPHLLPEILQETIQEVKDRTKQIILGYGLCSNGIVGLRAPPQGLIVTKAHDCISLFMGSREEYNKQFQQNPGTYYITPGWIKEQKDPLGILENEYIPKLGPEIAKWGAKEEIKNYTQIALINSGILDLTPYRSRAKENANYFDKIYLELSGNNRYLYKILFEPYENRDFFLLEHGEVVKQNWFFEDM